MGVTALMLRDSVGYATQVPVDDGQGGATITFSAPTTLRAKLNLAAAAPDDLAQQLAGRQFASIVVDDRALVPPGVQEGGRLTDRSGRVWEIRQVTRMHTDHALSSSKNELAQCACAEVVS